jgi:hypothetical protein
MDMFGALTLLGTFFAGVTVGAWLNGLTNGLERSSSVLKVLQKR